MAGGSPTVEVARLLAAARCGYGGVHGTQQWHDAGCVRVTSTRCSFCFLFVDAWSASPPGLGAPPRLPLQERLAVLAALNRGLMAVCPQPTWPHSSGRCRLPAAQPLCSVATGATRRRQRANVRVHGFCSWGGAPQYRRSVSVISTKSSKSTRAAGLVAWCCVACGACGLG